MNNTYEKPMIEIIEYSVPIATEDIGGLSAGESIQAMPD